MDRIKKIILSATIFILTICSTSIVFGANTVSYTDFATWVEDNLGIDIFSYSTCGMTQAQWDSFRSLYNSSNGFYIFKNNTSELYQSYNTNLLNNSSDIIFVFSSEETPSAKIKAENTDPARYAITFNTASTTTAYGFNNSTKNYTTNAGKYYSNAIITTYKITDDESVSNFFEEENSKYILHNQLLCASNYTFLVHGLANVWAYGLTVTEMKATPFPWEKEPPIINNVTETIYDYTDLPWRNYFKPYLVMNKKGLLDIDDPFNNVVLKVYSGDGSVDEVNITERKIKFRNI